MATVTGTAALEVTTFAEAVTGFVDYKQGYLDPVTDTIKATGTARWSTLTTWAEYQSYQQTNDPILWTSPLVDIGTVTYFTLDINCEVDGAVEFIIHISPTGEFAGEETQRIIADGDTDIEAFFGRYVYVTARVTGRELRRLTITSDRSTRTYDYPNIVTSELSGTIENRILEIIDPISSITEIHVAVKAADSYPVDLYVSSTATSRVLIPVVNSKSRSQPSIALYGIDNQPRDGVVDITIKGLPSQIMVNGSLRVLS